MAVTSERFAEELRGLVAERRAFWDHPFIRKFRQGELSKEQVRHWIEQQFYLTGRVHDLIGPLYVHCDDAKVRVEILNNLIEEETGKMSGSAPHPELYIRLGEALGSTRQRMLNIRALPESVALRTWWIWLVDNRPFVEGLASVSIAGEGGGALEIVANLARTDEEQQRVRDIVRNTLELLWRFFDGLATTPVEQITGKAA